MVGPSSDRPALIAFRLAPLTALADGLPGSTNLIVATPSTSRFERATVVELAISALAVSSMAYELILASKKDNP